MLDINVAQVVIEFIVLLFSLTVHESAHAWTADRLGDPTKAEIAVQKIGVAFVAMRDSGNTPAAAYYGEQLLKARALFGRLTSH